MPNLPGFALPWAVPPCLAAGFRGAAFFFRVAGVRAGAFFLLGMAGILAPVRVADERRNGHPRRGAIGTMELERRFWLCQGCGRHVPARLSECRCGFARAGQAGIGLPAPRERSPGAMWFAVGPAKLTVMSLATLGLYQFYWFYRQWRRVRDAGEDVWPLPRSLFGVLFCYPLFRRIADSARGMGVPAAGPGVLAAAYILLCLSSQLPMPFGLLPLLSVLPLASVQRAANAVVLRELPDEAPNTRLTPANWAAVAFGAAACAFVAYVLVLREKATSLESLSRIAAEANRAPREAKNGILLEEVVPREGMLIYHFSVTEDARARLEEIRPFLKRSVTPGLCRDRLLRLGVSVRFVYTGPGGEAVATVDVSPGDCS